jgi:catechol 2,3-dioxygenase
MSAQTIDSTLRFRMPAETRLAGLTLRVRSLEPLERFYSALLGLGVAERGDNRIRLAAARGRFSLDLLWDPAAPARPPRSLGLYHFALLLPDRTSLAGLARRLLEQRWTLDGASDHGVSEALYLHDPEDNGIELYRDRPRESWPLAQGQVAMISAPLDLDGLLAAAPAAAPIHPETRFGHIHLHVGDLDAGERFYAGTLGLEVTQRTYPGALFLAAGGYHHHVGLNTWGHGRRAPEGATGLVRYAWALPAGAGKHLETQLQAARAPYAIADAALTLTDPAGIQVEVREDPT